MFIENIRLHRSDTNHLIKMIEMHKFQFDKIIRDECLAVPCCVYHTPKNDALRLILSLVDKERRFHMVGEITEMKNVGRERENA